MKPPAIESAVQTTPPMTIAATMPLVPDNPMLTSTSDESMSVMSVMPDTGLEPTIAMAFAATVVKRNDMTKTIASATSVCIQLPSMPNWKNTSVATRVAIRIDIMVRIFKSRCVRTSSVAVRLPPSS